MDINKIDNNFCTSFKEPADLVWHDSLDKPFKTYGVFYSSKEEIYRRIEKEIAETVNDGVLFLSTNTAGGRIRFITNSPYIVIGVINEFIVPSSHMSVEGMQGLSFFYDHKFGGAIMPTYDEIKKGDPNLGGDSLIKFSGIVYPEYKNKECLIEIYMPLYASPKHIYIVLKDDAMIKEAPPYRNELPVVFYGSSITQGGCADKSSDDYINLLSRKLDIDVLNLGFSGSALGEETIANYIASKKASAYVIDYHHNAPTIEHLCKTHYHLYKAIRNKNKTTPIIMCTTPSIIEVIDPKNQIIIDSFNKAKENGDNNVYLVDFWGVFGSDAKDQLGSVDGCHPNSLGYLRMADKLYPILEKILK